MKRVYLLVIGLIFVLPVFAKPKILTFTEHSVNGKIIWDTDNYSDDQIREIVNQLYLEYGVDGKSFHSLVSCFCCKNDVQYVIQACSWGNEYYVSAVKNTKSCYRHDADWDELLYGDSYYSWNSASGKFYELANFYCQIFVNEK